MDELRTEFLRLLTEDSETNDARRREFNMAIFMPEGHAIWTDTNLSMVMDKFDTAVKNLKRGDHG